MSQPIAPGTAWAGVGIAEDIASIRHGVENGSWIDGSIGVVGAGLDTLALVSDPLGVLMQYGVAWIIEHVRPLTEALDQLAGDPAAIAGATATWRDIAAGLQWQAEEFRHAVRLDLSEWTGDGGDAYRARSAEQEQAVIALARAAETMAAITEGAGLLVAAVRLLVRDAIATLVSRLVVYAAEEVATLGAATPFVIEQVATLVSSWATRIAGWLRGLLRSLRNLFPAVERTSGHLDELRKLLDRIREKPAAPALHRAKKRGAGPIQLFRMESVYAVAAKYDIDLSGLRISLGPKSRRGYDGATAPDGSITLLSSAFRSEETLARTLVHERFHRDDLAAGHPYPQTDADVPPFEDRAYAYEEYWWNNQPIRPEPKAR
ncbi:hypothetical protein [Actinoplanes sp. NBRC 101535]|uniref:WXG100 family type VII secretion target n=1 Tax=Actinoplanes sp. NBRC 101535 TaxID=3032196 RepID=UPI0024A3D9E8|nr:hypothetical protein [Actinoplanes sp. NBRC 101535]GLY06765.1 hypothetical protein Acsp01_71440 [Actinoplanes sp. NBRC 101535]